jgi:hypothetical protein
MKKITKSTLPLQHSKSDFECFGPPAIEDGVFANTMLADLGCFKQGDIDSNKFYHAAVVQSTINNEWYVYFEHGRTGSSTNPQFQFISCSSKNEAQRVYEKQLHSKNDKRGEWIEHSVLGKILQPKPNKDCYLVRQQIVRTTGLPSAKTITIVPTSSKNSSVKHGGFDEESNRLLKDLDVGTVEYTRSSMSSNAIPTQEVIDEARIILNEATIVTNTLKTTNDVLNSSDLIDLTNMLYGRIPKLKSKTAQKEDWILTANNINKWRQDLDAFESTLDSHQYKTASSDQTFELQFIKQESDLGQFISSWMSGATRNRHSYISGKINIKNMWKIVRDTYPQFKSKQKTIEYEYLENDILHQTKRLDLELDNDDVLPYNMSNTCLLFHGTRSVNVGGILQHGLKLPRQLSNVSINGANFGSLIYAADDWKKAAGYSSLKNSYWARGSGKVNNRAAFMFVADVTLGKPYVPSRPQVFQKAPDGYDSIFAKTGKSSTFLQNNEYIIAEMDQINLRYLVEFSV